MSKAQVANQGSSDAEYRLVTILFADIVGSTSLTGEVEAETARLIFDRCLRTMSQVIDEFGGTVARLMGDGLLAFFGAPVAHEDDPERAALAAFQIHRSIQRYGSELDIPLQVRIGLNTGRVVMGDVGGESLSEYTAMGQPINLAARLQAQADPGSTLAGEATGRLIGHLFEMEALSGLQLKGFEHAQNAYRLTGMRERPEAERGLPGVETTLIGREQAQQTLVDRLSELQAGRGAIVAVAGDPGIGKSRLLHEAHRATGELALTWAEGRAASYAVDQPFSVIRDLLAELLELNPQDTPAMLDLKLERELMPLFGDRLGEVWPLLAALIGAPVPPAYAERLEGLEPDALKRGMTHAFCDLAEALAARGPLVLAFDDMHWADPSSLEVLRSLFLATERAPLLIILLFRPDREARIWELKAHAERDFMHRYTELILQPLSEGQTHEMVAQILANPQLPGQLLEFLRDKSEGNPFFVEELVRDLIESGTLTREGDAWQLACDLQQAQVPATLQEVVQARVDRLPQAERVTLQAAAVIGRRFGVNLLGAVTPQNGELAERLLALQRADLIRERARIPEPVFSFRQSVVQEVIYNQLLADQRRSLHLHIAQSLERGYSDRLLEHAAVIARHYELAGDREQALHYHRMAGDAAFKLNANHEAIEHYQRAIELSEDLPFDADRASHLYFSLGRAFELTAEYDRAMQTYRAVRTLAQAHDDPHLALESQLAQTTLRVTPTPLFDPEGGRQEAEDTLELARELKDPRAEAKMLWNLSLLGRFTADDEQAITYGEASLAIAEANGLQEQIGFTLTDLFWSYLAVRNTGQARQAIERAYGIWQELENRPMMADCLSGMAFLHFLRGEFDQSIKVSEQAWEASAQIDNLWGKSYSKLYVGLVYLELGDIGRALDTMHASREYGQQAGFVVPGVVLPAIEALTYAKLGSHSKALEMIDESAAAQYGDLTTSFINQVKAQILALAGDTELAQSILDLEGDEPSRIGTLHLILPRALTRIVLCDASGHFEQVLEYGEGLQRSLNAHDIHTLLPMLAYYRGRALHALGKIQPALEALTQGLELANSSGARWCEWRLLGLRSRIHREQGSSQEARADAAGAVERLEFIASHTGDEDLAAAFTALPEVAALLQQVA